MKRLYIFGMLVCVLGSCVAKRIIIDEVLAIVPHMGGDRIILASDTLMEYGNGEQKTFRDVVLEELMLVRARDLGIALPDAAVDSMLATIQKRSGMSRDQIGEMFEAQGLTWQEGRDMLRNRRMIEEMLSILVRPQEPTKEEIRAYYEQHAPLLPAEYTIRLAYIPATDMSEDEVQNSIATGMIPSTVVWDAPKAYTADALTKQQLFIGTMVPQEIRLMDVSPEGYDIIQLMGKKDAERVPYNEAQIVSVMGEAAYQGLLATFQEELLAHARIRFCKPDVEKLLH